jgi:predicted aminopeptidase
VTVALGPRLVSLAAITLLAGCSTADYYVDSVVGHLRVLHAARPVDQWLADPSTPEALRSRLIAVKAMRTFAVQDLDLPDNASYRSYADLHRPYVAWNVFAAPELSLELRKWCFPVAGCVTYRGYFNQSDAEAFADGLRKEGLDVQVAGVPAYSTLGFTPDPVLSTFIFYPEGEVARLIFHELGHQKVYLPGDTTFNESFATTVEEVGVQRWLKAQNDPERTRVYRQFESRKERFLALLQESRGELETLYAGSVDDAAKLKGKAAVFANLQQRYQAAKSDPADPLYNYTGYDGYFAQPLNNANLAAIATYSRLVPAFVKLLALDNGDLSQFYKDVEALAKSDPDKREARLKQLLQQAASG